MILNGVKVQMEPAGGLYIPRDEILVVADLHFEKGSAYAARGLPLPPYDTASTLADLAGLLQRLRPRTVVCLGDSFHDSGAGRRLNPVDRDHIRKLTGSHDWIWIVGNHDPEPPLDLGGRIEAELMLDGLLLRHQPRARAPAGEIAGHLHPKATLKTRGRRIQRRCFASDGRRMILPSFGAYTGGLDVLDQAFASLFPGPFHAHMISDNQVLSVASHKLG